MDLHEKCGVIGIYSNQNDIARSVYYGLWSLQHRGQENSGIASSNGKKFFFHKGKGLVSHVYAEKDLDKLKGHIAIGHNRYSTFGKTDIDHSQPVCNHNDTIALAHNGNLPLVSKLKKFLTDHGIAYSGLNDSEMMFKTVEYHFVKTRNIVESLKQSFELFTGAFSLVVMTKKDLVGVRDSNGIRPLCIGKFVGGYVLASESCALDTIGAEFVRDVEPGEMIVINENGLTSFQLGIPNLKFDVFEFIYFARPDSRFMGKSVYEVRKRLGEQLALESKIKADVVIPVPDSSIPSAIGFSNVSKIPFEMALTKNRYIHRTFIKPAQKNRMSSVKMKLNITPELITGKDIIIIDDSIVRGTTSKRLADLLRTANPKSIHFFISSPPVIYPDFYGIDTPDQSELISSKMNNVALANYIGVDSVQFLSYSGMIDAIGLPESQLCTSCFSGIYPIGIGSKIKKLKLFV